MPADCRQQESLCQASGDAQAVLGKLCRARLQDLQRPSSTRERRGETPSAAALRRQAGASSPARTSAGSWSRRRAEGPAAPSAADVRAPMLRCGVRSKKIHTMQGTNTPHVAKKQRVMTHKVRALTQPSSGCSGGQPLQCDCRRSAELKTREALDVDDWTLPASWHFK